MINRIRDWIDAREYRVIMVAIALVETPLILALWIVTATLGAPWWLMLAIVGGGFVVVTWVILAVSALTRWLS